MNKFRRYSLPVLALMICFVSTAIPQTCGFIVTTPSIKQQPSQVRSTSFVAVSSSSSSSRSTRLHVLPADEERKSGAADFPPEENLNDDVSKVDWDAEWKKVVANQNQPVQRPGQDFYKSEAEIAAIKAANRATRELEKLRPPSFSSLQGDWKFWVGILAVISVGAALIQGAAFNVPPGDLSGSDSYYI